MLRRQASSSLVTAQASPNSGDKGHFMGEKSREEENGRAESAETGVFKLSGIYNDKNKSHPYKYI